MDKEEMILNKECKLDKAKSDIEIISVEVGNIDVADLASIDASSNEEDVQQEATLLVMDKCNTMNVTLDYDFFIDSDYAICRRELKNTITSLYNKMISYINRFKADRAEKLSYIRSVPASMVAEILKNSNDIRRVNLNGLVGGTPMLAVRIRDYDDEKFGTYALQTVDNSVISRMIENMNFKANEGYISEVIARLEKTSTSIQTYPGFDIFICKNGIYETKTKDFIEFDTDAYEEKYGNYAFLNKLTVNYNDKATLVTIHNDEDGTDWNIDDGIREAFDDQDDCDVKVRAFMQILNHALRFDGASHNWYFINSSKMCEGGGMKSTLIQLMINMMMEENVCTSSMDELAAGNFGLEPVVGKCAIMSDETDSDSNVIESSMNLKKLARNEKCTINRKHKNSLVYRFVGVMIQASNDFPRFRNANKSTVRTSSVLNFEKSFVSEGQKERKYIKNDYIARQEVLEYLLLKTIEMGAVDYDEEVLEACSPVKTGLLSASLPVYIFIDELLELHPNAFVGCGAVPDTLLFDMFHKWFESTNNTKSGMQIKKFRMQLKSWISEHKQDWDYNSDVFRINKSCDIPAVHNLLIDYDVIEGWLDIIGPVGASSGAKFTQRAMHKAYRGSFVRLTGSNSKYNTIAFAENTVATKAAINKTVVVDNNDDAKEAKSV